MSSAVRFIVSLTGIMMMLSCTSDHHHSAGQHVNWQLNRIPSPPVATTIPEVLSNHGHDRTDNYYWLRDDERRKPEVIDYLTAENNYTDEVLAPTDSLQNLLFEEMKGRIRKDDDTVPYEDNGYWYYSRYAQGKEYAIHCRRERTLQARELIIFDENERASGYDYYSLGDIKVSDNNQVLAFAEDTVSRRQYKIGFLNLIDGQQFKDVISDTTGTIAWAADNRSLFYTRREAGTLRAFQVWVHRLGSEPATDRLVYEETDKEFSVHAWRTRSRDYIVISSSQTLTDEHRLIPAGDPDAEPILFLPREKGHEHSIDHGGDRWFIRTNWQAENFRLMATQGNLPQDKDSWQEIVPHNEAVLLQDIDPFKNWLALSERRDGQTGLRILSRQDRQVGKQDWLVQFTDPAYTVHMGVNPEFDKDQIRYTYTSLTTPTSVFDYDLTTRQSELRKEQAVLGGFRRDDYISERLMVKVADNVEVPVSLVYRRDLDRSKPAPLYLYGYGSYGISMNPYFSSSRLSLLDRGFIYAIAHVRGGEEFGRHWYEDGKLLRKKNSFFDFIAATRHLISTGYTSSDLLVASGGSAGGLLVGAVTNMQPELYRAIIAHVPFVDVVTTMLDETIPLTTFEYDEWGNPNQENDYSYMLSYSPYDNVEVKDYPNMLIFTGLHDSQVQYWEPAKWVAKLRANKTDNNLILLTTNMTTGHSGVSGRFQSLHDLAKEYAFLLALLAEGMGSE